MKRSTTGRNSSAPPRTIVIGLDGVSWNLLEPLLSEGKLPTIAQLRQRGTWGDLQSTIPPLTMPAWHAFSTGKNPGKLGIFNFYQMRERSYEVFRPSGILPAKARELWDLLNDHGKVCGVLNDPVTFPPKKITGYLVSGFLAPSERVLFTYPPELKKELDRVAGGYEIDASHGEKSDEVVIEGCHRVLEKRCKIFEHFLAKKDTDFLLAVFTAPDRIAHQLLNRTQDRDDESRQRAKHALEKFWIALDACIGRLLRYIGTDEHVIIISDHGSQPQQTGIYLNQWLINEGYLTINQRPGLLERLGITQRRIKGILDTLKWKRVEQTVRASAPAWLRKRIPEGAAEGKGQAIIDLINREEIDWSKTKAIAIPGGIYINTKDRPNGIVQRGDEYDSLVAELTKKLIQKMPTDLGENIQVQAFRSDSVYQGPFCSGAPDIMYVIDDYRVAPMTTIPTNPATLIEREKRLAHHRKEGMVIALGPYFKQNTQCNAELIDIAPTILHMFDLPIPDDIDGHVLLDFFAPESPWIQKPPRRQSMLKFDTREQIQNTIDTLTGI